jgi:hypothetical protein
MKSLILIALFLFACSSPSEPEQNFTLDNPPAQGVDLFGQWRGETGYVLSQSGMYDPGNGDQYTVSFKGQGSTVYLRAYGVAQLFEFIGTYNGNKIVGTSQLHNYTPKQGITYSWPRHAYTFTRIE